MRSLLLDEASNTSRKPYRFLLWTVIAFLTVNVVLLSTFRPIGSQRQAILHSIFVSEVALVAIWATLSKESLSRRVGTVFVLAILGWITYLVATFLAPQFISTWETYGWRSLIIGSIHPTMTTSAGVTLAVNELLMFTILIGSGWIYRSRTGHLLCHGSEPAKPMPGIRFSTGQLLLWTALIGISIVLGRQVFDTTGSLMPRLPRLPRLGLLCLYSSLAGVSMVVCIECTLSQRRRFLCTSMWLLSIPFLAAICVGVGPLIVRRFMPGEALRYFLASSIFFAGFQVIVTLVLLSAKRAGFRLIPR